MDPRTATEDFEQLSWHDNYVYGIYFFSEGWQSGLVLDIDHIVEWVCGVDRQTRFRVAPTTLLFHDVTDLRMDVDWGDSGFQVALHAMSIGQIGRERIENQKICLDRPYYQWKITTTFPRGGEIAFGASGFTQSLRQEPILSDQQQVHSAGRAVFNPIQHARALMNTGEEL